MRGRVVAWVVLSCVGVAAGASPARAEPWQGVAVLALHLDDDGRVGVGAITGSGLGGGPWHDTSRGLRAVYHLTDGAAIGAELRDIDARDRLADVHLPRAAWSAAHPPPRRRAAGVDLELRPALGKVAAGGSVYRFDVLASAGLTALWTDEVRPAASFGLGIRVRLGARVRLDVGLHDDVYRQPRGPARALAAGGALEPGGIDTLHALEARAGLTILWPPRPRARCDGAVYPYRRNPLEDQPAL